MNHLDDFMLNEYLDHALDKSRRVEVDAHLHACAACHARLEEFQTFFAELKYLPEAHLEHDLTPAVLARLPRKAPIISWRWTRAFAAQLGVAVGFMFWLVMQAIPYINIPQLALPRFPRFDFEILAARLLSFHFPMPKFQLSVLNVQIPTFSLQLPSIDMQISTNHLTVMVISTILLWVVGDVILLRGRQEVS
jgi:hypothetical protein